jgi:SAM-dependent methyltransferase
MSVDPDSSARGLLGREPDPLRYGEGDALDPFEAPGIIRSLTPDHVRVLDVGCGAGALTVAIHAGKNNEVACVEPDPLRSAAARARGLCVHEGFFDAKFAQGCGTFDVIVFADVLEHLADPSAVLRMARDCLKSRGSLIVSVPNVAHWTVRLRLLLGRFQYADGGIMDATHLRWFTRNTLVSLLQNAGFTAPRIRGSAGMWMPEYHRGPLGLMPLGIRRFAVLVLLRLWPRLLACQWIIAVRPAEAASEGSMG